jgi:2'-5' RNA ligase
MNTIRAFFAIVPSTETHIHLVNVLQSLKQEMPKDYIHWVNLDRLHITLNFVGQLRLEDIVPLSQKVSIALKQIPRFQLNLGPVEWFPTLRHPKILSFVVEPQDILCKLAGTIAQSLSSLEYPLESRPFRGHMTLGRVHHYSKNQVLLSSLKLGHLPPIIVDTVYLFESKMMKGKTSYSTLDQFNLT